MGKNAYVRFAVLPLLAMLFARCGAFNECSDLECQNNGECRITTSGEARCICEGAYYGTFCENFDACYDIVCPSNASCNEGDCICKLGYEGADCETVSRNKFVGTYAAVETCVDGTVGGNEAVADFECTIATHDTIDLRLLFANEGTQGLLTNIYATLSDSLSFTIPEQTDTIFARVFEGIANGEINAVADTITAEYYVSLLPVDSLRRCNLTLIKQ